jgi:hypothetical protein
VLQSTGEWLQSLLPQDMDNYLSQMLRRKPRGDEQEPPDGPPPDRRSGVQGPTVTGSVPDKGGYPRADRTDMRQLIDATRR